MFNLQKVNLPKSQLAKKSTCQKVNPNIKWLKCSGWYCWWRLFGKLTISPSIVIRTNATRTNVIRTNVIRTNVIRTNIMRSNKTRKESFKYIKLKHLIRTNITKTFPKSKYVKSISIETNKLHCNKCHLIQQTIYIIANGIWANLTRANDNVTNFVQINITRKIALKRNVSGTNIARTNIFITVGLEQIVTLRASFELTSL